MEASSIGEADLLYLFDGKYTKTGTPLAIVKDEAEIREIPGMEVMHYRDDFESKVTFRLPSKNRRKKQMISLKESEAIIGQADYGVLSFTFEGVPYSVGMNHVYRNGRLYFHSAPSGFKLNGVRCPVSYLVIEDLGINEAQATHNHESVMIQGSLQIVDDSAEKMAFLRQLMAEKAPSNTDEVTEAMVKSAAVLALDIHYMSGKSHIR